MTEQPNWFKKRWLELRMGYSSYLAYGLSFFNLMLLLSIRFGGFFVGYIGTFVAAVLVFMGISTPAIVLGHLHLKHQQKTDILLEYETVIEETAKRVITKLKEEKVV